MPAPASIEVFSHLVNAIYDCSIAPGGWSDVIEEICGQFGFANGMMSVTALSTRHVLFHATARVDPEDILEAANYGPEILALWGGASRIERAMIGEPLVLSRSIDEGRLKHNRYFREWAEPQGLFDAVTIPILRGGNKVSRLSLASKRSAGYIDEQQISGLRHLIPHLRRAVSIGAILDLKTVQVDVFTSLLESLTVGVILVDERVSIMHANGAAEAMLANADWILQQGGRLAVRHADADTALQAAVHRLARELSENPREAIGIPMRQLDGTVAMLHVLPLCGGKVRPDVVRSAVAAVFVLLTPQAPPAASAQLAELFCLTHAEARIFSMICEGRTLAEISALLSVKSSTAKTHLLRVFEKTGCRRQAELVKLAASVTWSL